MLTRRPRSRFTLALCAAASLLAGCASSHDTTTEPESTDMSMFINPESDLPLGNFSVSLSVKDIHVSKQFYETLGFNEIGGNIDQNWLILRNGDAVIGLFQGMFEGNLMTFNPGWTRDGNHPADGDFTDIRAIQQTLLDAGITLHTQADPESTGPASLTLSDPDGNVILIDQHR